MGRQHIKGSIGGTLLCVFVFIALILAGFVHKFTQSRILNKYELQQNGVILLETPRKFSEFKFTDHNGNPFGSDQLKDKWSLLFFGFTHCPDICPTTMAAAAKMYAELDEDEKEQIGRAHV